MSLVLAILLTFSFIAFLGGLLTLGDDANLGCFLVIVGGLASAGFWILMQ
jgi:hypothetical protein